MGVLKLEDMHYTYDDYKQWEGDWELMNGIAVAMSPAPMRKHQSLAARIIRQLDEQLDDCKRCEVLGEVDYKVADDTILRPDIALTCDETNENYLTKAPQIIVEIVSKSTVKRDENYKFEIYAAELVNYYIIVYPDDLVAKVYKNSEGKFTKQGDFANESYDFENTSCSISLDFKKVFERYRD